jgi:hypothetical protein
MSLMHDVESWLRGSGIPYIAVDEAKKALFAGSKLRSFHFVAYCATGLNWLLCCGERTAENLQDMRQWRDIFGDGFKAVFAVKRKGGMQFRDLEGEPVDRFEILPRSAREEPREETPAIQERPSEPCEPTSPNSHPTAPTTGAPVGSGEVLGNVQATLF